MATQFIHIDAYSRKGSKGKSNIRGVIDEAVRVEAACTHVESPKEPTYLRGADLSGWWEHWEEFAAGATTPSVSKLGKKTNRKLRADRPLLAAGVASFPVKRAEANPAEVKAWEAKTLEFLKNRYGDQLGPVIRHADESHPHIHFYLAPVITDHDSGYSLDANHEGNLAANVPVKNKSRKSVYTKQMRKFQDAYYSECSAHLGMTRTGPKRQRLTRKGWMEKVAEAGFIKTLLEQVEKLKKVVSELRGDLKTEKKSRRMSDNLSSARGLDEVQKAAKDNAREEINDLTEILKSTVVENNKLKSEVAVLKNNRTYDR